MMRTLLLRASNLNCSIENEGDIAVGHHLISAAKLCNLILSLAPICK